MVSVLSDKTRQVCATSAICFTNATKERKLQIRPALVSTHLHRFASPNSHHRNMSGHQYITNNAGRLWEDDDIDDDTFLQNANPGGGRSELDQIQAKRVEIEQRTLSSTNRSLGLLHETEQCGIATAEELAKQREQLENTNKQLDEINTTLRFSQKHLNGLKSVFGGLKNYLSGQKNQPPPPSSSRGASAVNPSGYSSNGMTNSASSPTDHSYESHPVSRLRGDVQTYEQASPSTDGFNQQLENNLDLMAGSISRLKGLAIDLNTDIDGQNELIDTITNKVEDVDVKIQRQNRDMNKLLGKK